MKKSWQAITRERIASGVLEESVIRKMRAILAAVLNSDRYPERNKTPLRVSDAWDIIEHVQQARPRVTDAQARKGAEWLHGLAFTPSGKVRGTEFAQQLTEHDLQVIRECRAAPRFELVDLDVIELRGYVEHVAPVYRCHGADGKSFDYFARAWQSGGGSFVVDGSRRFGGDA